jgi:c-ets proto-oncogene protein
MLAVALWFSRFADVPSSATLVPLTPGINRKLTDALKSSFDTFERERVQLHIPADPHRWTVQHVAHWLHWAIREFNVVLDDDRCSALLRLNGAELCALTKEQFIKQAPDFLGDIFWEHLDMLRKGIYT